MTALGRELFGITMNLACEPWFRLAVKPGEPAGRHRQGGERFVGSADAGAEGSRLTCWYVRPNRVLDDPSAAAVGARARRSAPAGARRPAPGGAPRNVGRRRRRGRGRP